MTAEDLRYTFTTLAKAYTNDDILIEQHWQEIASAYTHKNRYYHSLRHLQQMMAQLISCKTSIHDWPTVQFALFYHDIVYNVLKGDNEERSAEVAQRNLRALGVPADMISRCVSHVLATKGHARAIDSDTNFFIDADLAILGHAWDEYIEYARQIREEYSIYPNVIYRPGRKKILIHFLNMDRIYKSDHFFHLYETQAKANISRELQEL